MGLDNYRYQIRALTFISAGAALIAVIGYLLMKSDRKKAKRKSSDNDLVTNEENLNQQLIEQDHLEIDIKKIEIEELKVENIDEVPEIPFHPEISLDKVEEDEVTLSEEQYPRSNETLLPTSSLNPQEEESPESTLPLINEYQAPKPIIYNSDVEVKLIFDQSSDRQKQEKTKDQFYNSSLIYSNSSKEDEIEEINSDNQRKASKIEILTDKTIIQQQDHLIQQQLDQTKELSYTSSPIYSNSSKEEEDDVFKANQDGPIQQEDTGSEKVRTFQSSSESSVDKQTFSSIDTNESVSTNDDICSESKNSSLSTINTGSSKNNINGKGPNKKRTPSTASNTSSLNYSLSPSNKNASKSLNSKRTKSKKNKVNKLHEPSSPIYSSRTNDDLNDVEDLVVYEFNFPRKLCGKLIGKNGVHVDFIRSKTNTQIAVRNDSKIEELQVVCVSGRISDVDKALDIIGNRFPSKLFPQISFKPISKPIVYRRFNKEKTGTPEDLENSKIFVASTNFVEFGDIKSDQLIHIQVTAIVNAGHVFVQLPAHSSYVQLQELDKNMLDVYDNMTTEIVPIMNEPIEYGTICAAPTSYGWHRAMVTNYQSYQDIKYDIPDYNEMCGLATVKFLDYGGYLNIPVNQLRQLRSDFMTLPFQGVECYLDGSWLPNQNLIEEGKAFLSQQLKNSRTEALVMGYSEDGIPRIRIFITNDAVQKFCINNELAKYGLVINYKSENGHDSYESFNGMNGFNNNFSSSNGNFQHNEKSLLNNGKKETNNLNSLKIVKTENQALPIK